MRMKRTNGSRLPLAFGKMKMAISAVDLPVSQSKYQRQTIKLCNTSHSPRLLCPDVGCVSHVVRSEGIRNEKKSFANTRSCFFCVTLVTNSDTAEAFPNTASDRAGHNTRPMCGGLLP